MTKLTIINTTRSNKSIQVNLAESFFSKLAGLMFRKCLSIDSGILLSDSSDSILNSSIHMLFMNFDICAVWISSSFEVVDVKIAKKWHLAYFPAKPAKYVLEAHPTRISDYSIGDQLHFDYEK